MTQRPRIAHQTVVFPTRYLSQTSPPPTEVPPRERIAMYPIPITSAEIPPTRYIHFPSGSPTFTVILSTLLRVVWRGRPSPADFAPIGVDLLGPANLLSPI